MKAIAMFKLAVLTVLAMAFLIVSGCRTAEGFGRDLEDAGEAIQRETR